ncbi:hypothetical protein LIER_33103 [Lithospermum erythrorhizon]|uniref:CASP-like protein n=1 Tax=Lithospermum erythrorhizon TaxID=34254 RepID=A0AAV3RY92_LITER
MKLLSNLLISGAAASFGLTVDLKRSYDGGFDLGKQFYDKIYASTSLCLIAFVFAAIATIISHMNASRKSA